jgi:hypothetical protein
MDTAGTPEPMAACRAVAQATLQSQQSDALDLLFAANEKNERLESKLELMAKQLGSKEELVEKLNKIMQQSARLPSHTRARPQKGCVCVVCAPRVRRARKRMLRFAGMQSCKWLVVTCTTSCRSPLLPNH